MDAVCTAEGGAVNFKKSTLRTMCCHCAGTGYVSVGGVRAPCPRCDAKGSDQVLVLEKVWVER